MAAVLIGFLCSSIFENYYTGALGVDIVNHDRSLECHWNLSSWQIPAGHTPVFSQHLWLAMQNFGCSAHLHTWAKVFNNWYPPERYFYASSSLSDDIFGPSLGNSPFVSVITWECWGKQQRNFRESGVVTGRHASHYLLVFLASPWFLISFSLFKLLSYHKSQYFKLKCEPHFNINLVFVDSTKS